MKVAVTLCAVFIDTTHCPVPEQPPPDQPAKTEPAVAPAVRVTVYPP